MSRDFGPLAGRINEFEILLEDSATFNKKL